MTNDKSKFWFPVKKYGWGWGPPCTLQGWLVIVGWLGLLLAGGFIIAPRNIILFVAYAVALGVVLLVVVSVKGEKPGFRWGEENNQPPRSVADRLAELDSLRQRRLISDGEYETKRQEILKEI